MAPLADGERQQHLGDASGVEVDLQRDQGAAGDLDRPGELLDLATVEEEKSAQGRAAMPDWLAKLVNKP